MPKGKRASTKSSDEEVKEEETDTEDTETSDEETTDEEEKADESDEEETPDTNSVSVSYVDPQKGLTERVFSHEIHGKDFKKLAKQFSEKFGGK